MDSTELNKIVGAVIGALLVFLLLGFFSGKLYGTRDSGHHDEPQAFALEIEETGGATETAEVATDYVALIAAADLDAGKKVFGKCRACHKVEDGANGVGPHLWGVVGREKQAVDGFNYSGALAAVGGSWGFTELNGFLEKPSAYAPGTSMSYAGLRKPEDRVNLIAWLNAEGGSNVDLTEGLDQAAAPAETETAAATTEAEAPAQEAEASAETEASTEQAAAPAEDTAAAQEEAPAQEEQAAAPAATEEQAAAPAASEEQAAAPAETEIAAAAFPAGDADAGKKVFRKCRACHKMEDGANGVGPHLWGVVNREIGGVEGFKYSDALANMSGAWTATELSAFLEKPKDYAPGTKMAFAGLKKEEDRVNLITYLNEADGSPEPLQ